jgi:hypothetical protein
MGRRDNFGKLAKRRYGATASTASLTEAQLEKLSEEYAKGAQQQFRGDFMAEVVKRFLSQVGDHAAGDIEENIKSLHGISNFKRFRIRALTLLMIVANNTAVVGPFDLRATMKQVSNDLMAKAVTSLDTER